VSKCVCEREEGKDRETGRVCVCVSTIHSFCVGFILFFVEGFFVKEFTS